MSKSRAIHFSGWLSPPFTQGQTFSSDDLTIFKCFKVIFSLKNKTIQFPLSFNLYLKKKKTAPKLPICHLPAKCSV